MSVESPSTPIVPVIMAGGSGTRLWPLSRAGFPKQFLCLTGKESLFQQAFGRLQALGSEDACLRSAVVIGNEEHRFLIQDQLREMGAESQARILLEPVGRNTAPAMTLAALAALSGPAATTTETETKEDPVLVVTPADQAIGDGAAFTKALQAACALAAQGALVVLGIRPDRPETGYGYIHAKQPREEATAGSGVQSAQVLRFVEKPALDLAKEYLADGHYFWNSGMFVVRASVWCQALERFRPDILAATRSAWDQQLVDTAGGLGFIRPHRESFENIPAESIDYAVMEKAPGDPAIEVLMVPLDAGWSDLGAWDAVWQTGEKDSQGNVSQGDVIQHQCHNTLVHASSRLVTTIGLNDVVVVETPDAVLVSDRSRSQDVKRIVEQLQSSGRQEHRLHRQVHRPWGGYDSIDAGARFQVKRIWVKPGASLSLQMHHHRAEHWIVVQGTAEITNGDRSFLLSENQSTYIPLGQVHRLANPGKVTLEIIEVQSGSYLGEDDIVRYEDTYGRTQ